jgi:rod shape-determining protein MreD
VILAIVSFALVQMTLLQTPLGFPVPLMLVLVVCRALVAIGAAFPDAGIVTALRWSCYGGLALDSFSTMPLGSHVLALLLAVLLVAGATRSLRVDGPLISVAGVLAGSLAYELTLAGLNQLLRAPIEWRSYALVVIVPSVLIALIPAPPVFFFMRRMLRGE